MLKTFDLNEPFDLHLGPPSSKTLPLCRIMQDGEDPLLQQISILQTWNQESGYLPFYQQTMRYPYQTQQQQQPITHHLRYQLTHSNQAKFDYTPGSCILLKLQFWISEVKRSLQHWIWLTLFMSYIYVPQTVITKKNPHQMAEGKDKKPTNPNKQLSDSDTSDDEPINPKLKTSVEERHYCLIPSLVLATQAALSHLCAQANPTME